MLTDCTDCVLYLAWFYVLKWLTLVALDNLSILGMKATLISIEVLNQVYLLT